MKALLREPILYFIIAGMALFYVHGLVSGDELEYDDAVIRVSDADLTRFLQFRAKAFNAEYFDNRLRTLSQQELDNLVDEYVREEVLYREATKLGMAEGDYIIRRRMIQKMEFILRGLGERAVSPEKGEVEAYFHEHIEDYIAPATIDFTHVFFDAARHGRSEARALANAEMATLNRDKASPDASVNHGDRFPYHLNYVEKTLELVERHFDKEFAERIFDDNLALGQWLGPIASTHGEHIVFISRREDSRIPEFSSLLERVERDWRFAELDQLQLAALERAVSQYRVERTLSSRSEP